MSKRLYNPRLVRINLSYRLDDIARLYGVSRGAVRRWIKRSLKTIDQRRPTMVAGHDLAEFLHVQRTADKCHCQPGEIYCIRCRAAKTPAGGTANYRPLSSSTGDLAGTCPDCNLRIHRRVSLIKLEEVRGLLSIRFLPGVYHD